MVSFHRSISFFHSLPFLSKRESQLVERRKGRRRRGRVLGSRAAIPFDGVRVGEERSETLARVLGTPLGPHRLRLQSPAGEELHVRGQPRVHVLVGRVTVGRRVAPKNNPQLFSIIRSIDSTHHNLSARAEALGQRRGPNDASPVCSLHIAASPPSTRAQCCWG